MNRWTQATTLGEAARAAAALAVALAAVVAAQVGTPGTAHAAVPGTVLLEGTLQAAGGGPAADGTYGVTFAVYKDEQGGVPLWQEPGVNIAVKSGQFSYPLGTTAPIKVGALPNGGGWLGIKIANDPELPRKPLHAVTAALRAGLAEGLDCSGCVTAQQLNPNVLEQFNKMGALSDVALTGNYKDLKGYPQLATVATSGLGKDLKDSVHGKACGSGLVIAGIKDDGSLDCVKGGGAGDLPPDGLDEISNGLLTNQFVDVMVGKSIVIQDNNPLGATDEIDFPDIGLSQKLFVSVEIPDNTDLSGVTVWLYDAANKEHVLYQKTLKKGDTLKATYPDPDKAFSGDLAAWYGKNPVGKWRIKVADLAFKDNKTDGALKWSVGMQTLSNKKIQVKGDLIIDGNLTVAGTASVMGQKNDLAQTAIYRWAVWSTFDQSPGWFGQSNPGADGNGDALLFGGIKPQVWSDGNGIASNMSADKNVLRTLFNKTAKIYPNTNVWAEAWYSYSSTNGKLAGALFRIKNSTSADIVWSPMFNYTSYHGWAEIASAQINGINSWQSNNDCYANCTKTVAMTVPKNRISTAIFVSASSPAPGSIRSVFLAFINNSLALPPGLTFVDDFDTATGGWEQ